MKAISVAALASAAFLPGMAIAQSSQSAGSNSLYAANTAADPAADMPAGTPSVATATVSPFTAVQGLEQLDPSRKSLSISLATSYARGDFGSTSHSEIISSAIGARLALGDFRLTASLPWMRIRSNGTLYTGIDATPVIVAPGTGPRKLNKGFGDLTLGAAYTLTPHDGGTEIEVSGRIKLNTASNSSGLSSGKTDYSAGIQVQQPMGHFVPFVSAAYRILGDPTGFNLRNGVALSAGSSIVVGSRSLVILSYHYAESASRLVGDSHELFAGASTELKAVRLRLTTFATAGLSQGAAGFSAGFGVSRAF